jgi:hypothetical protein
MTPSLPLSGLAPSLTSLFCFRALHRLRPPGGLAVMITVHDAFEAGDRVVLYRRDSQQLALVADVEVGDDPVRSVTFSQVPDLQDLHVVVDRVGRREGMT